MTRKILINGRREEELRVAIVDNQTLEDFEIETKSNGLLRNNIYRAVVSNIAPSLNAAFVDFGDVKNGFLAFNDVVESAYGKHVKDANKISDVLVPGQQLIVQVIKDATSLKGAQVTTNISLAGRYLVLRPKDAKSGISHKLDNDARADLTQKVRSLDLPEGYGCIVRTNAMDQSRAILLRDAKVLVQLWRKIEAEFAKGTGPQLLYNDQDIVVQVMRDYFDSTINEVLIDDKSCYERAKTYVRATIESSVDKIKLYEDKMPIFTRYGLEKQISQIYARMVSLPSGGFIVIDPTEALTAIDVNSAHATKRESQDLTAYHTNLEAAAEIGRQLRMRDIGGLIVVDFIDMKLGKHQRDVERVMRNAMARDKARIKVERISANGLLEINRQRLNQSLSQRTHLECPTCGGRGYIPSVEAIGMNLIREIDARAVGGDLGGVVIKLHPDIAQQVQNERRREFAQLELDYGIRIEIVASRDIGRGDESIEWLTKRQENELHPAKAATTSADAASIIDVAEAYTSESSDDAYRPNDFEEFSSDEARKKRAAKRAARREMQAADVDNAKDEVKTPKQAASAIKVDDNAEAKAEVKAETKEARQDSSTENKRVKKRALPLCVTGLIVLSAFIAQMQGFMHEEGGHKHRRFNVRSRRKFTQSEPKSLETDYRFFALDVARAICVQWLGLPQDASKKDVLAQFETVSQWLMLSTKQPKEEIDSRVETLRSKMQSRHAAARMECLFDEMPGDDPDALAQVMLEERDNVLGNSRKLDESLIHHLNERMLARCKAVFNKADAADEAEIDEPVVDMSDAHAFTQEEIDDMIEAMSADVPSMDEVSVADHPMERSRRRHARRAAIGEAAPETVMEAAEDVAVSVSEVPSSDEPHDGTRLATEHRVGRNRHRHARRKSIGEAAAARYVGDNAEIVSADVPILPMTIEQEKTEDSSESLAQAITQELPAVDGERRERRSRRRRDIVASAESDETKADQSAVEAKSAENTEKTEEENLEDIDTSEMLPRVSRPTERRVRRTRDRRTPVADASRARIQEKAEMEAKAASEMAEKVEVPVAEPSEDEVSSSDARRRRRSSRARIGEAEVAIETAEAPAMVVSAEDTQEMPVAEPAPAKSRESRSARRPQQPADEKTPEKRRVRKTRPVHRNETADEIAPAAETPVEPVVEEAPVTEDAPKRRVRRTRRNEAASQKTQEDAADNAVEANSADSARRVRRTRRTSIDHD